MRVAMSTPSRRPKVPSLEGLLHRRNVLPKMAARSMRTSV